jgi:hypothetical protein
MTRHWEGRSGEAIHNRCCCARAQTRSTSFEPGHLDDFLEEERVHNLAVLVIVAQVKKVTAENRLRLKKLPNYVDLPY